MSFSYISNLLQFKHFFVIELIKKYINIVYSFLKTQIIDIKITNNYNSYLLMKNYFTLLALNRKLVLAFLLAFTFLLPNIRVYGQIINFSNFGTMYNPHLINVRADTYHYGPQTFEAYQYDVYPFYPPGVPKVYALVLYRGGLPIIDPTTPVLVTAEDPTSPFGVNAFTDEIGPIPQPDLPIPLITNTFLQSTTTNPTKPVYTNTAYTSEMAANLFWGIQYILALNEPLYQCKGLDVDGKLPVSAKLSTSLGPKTIASFDPNTNMFTFGVDPNGLPGITLDVIGHEMCHGMLFNSKYYNHIQSKEKLEAEEGICNVLGLTAKNYYLHKQLQPLSWSAFDEIEAIPADDLKNNGFPTVYKGLNYHPYGDPLFNPYKNSTILLQWLHMLCVGEQGTITDPGLPITGYKYNVKPLTTNPYIAMEMASQFLFHTCGNSSTSQLIEDLPTLARASISHSFKYFGYASPAVVSIKDAWFAVGLGKTNFAGTITPAPCPSAPLALQGYSRYNSKVTFNGSLSIGTEDQSILGLPDKTYTVPTLRTCATPTMPAFETEYINTDGSIDEAYDADNDVDKIYDLLDDKDRSQSAVSVHWASQKAAEHLYSIHNFIGIDGTGATPIQSYLSQDTKVSGFSPDDLAFYYDYDGDPGNPRPAVSMDLVGSNIGYAAAYLQLKPDPAGEADAICKGFGDIIGLTVKNKELLAQGKPTVWTIGEDLFKGTDYLRSFSDPKSKKQPTYYQGEYYNDGDNGSLLNFWFNILAEGRTSHLDNNPSKPLYSVLGIGTYEAEEILWAAVMNSAPGEVTDFLSLRKAAEAATTTPPELHAVQEAFYAIGVGPSPEELLASNPKDEEVEINPWPLNGPTGLKKEILYSDFENAWEVDISTDKDFKGVIPIHTIKDLTRDKDTQVDNNGVRTLLVPSLNLNLQTGTKYYWRVRTVGFDMCHFGQTVTDCALLKTQLSLGTDVRSFKTDGRDIDKAQIETPYPWGPAFHWATKADVPGSEIQYYILDIFHKDEKESFIQRAYDPKPGATQFNPTTKPDYLVLKPQTDYGWAVRAMGPEDVFGEKTFSLANRMDFKTDEVTSGLIFPEDDKKIDLFHYNTDVEIAPIFFTKWQPAVNAEGYRVEFSKSETDFSKLVPGSDPDYEGTLQLFNPGPSPDENNTYFWRVTPLGPPLTSEDVLVLNEGSTSDVHSFTYDYKSTKPKLREFPSVAALQSQIHFSWEEVPGADYYKIILGHKGMLNPDAPAMIEVVDKTALVSLGNGIMGFDRVYSGTSNLPLKDLASSADGYEWQVTAWKTDPLQDFPGEPARSSYDVLPGTALILSPADDNAVLDAADVQNQKVYYQMRCNFAPGGFTFKMGTALDQNGQITDLVTPGGQPITLQADANGALNGFMQVLNTTDLYTLNQQSNLLWDTEYFAQFIPLGRPGSGLEGTGEIRHFRTPAEPEKKKDPVEECVDLGLTFDFGNAGGLPLNIVITNPDGVPFDFKEAVQDALWNNQTFDMGPWGGDCGSTGKVKKGNYILQVQVFQDPGPAPACNLNTCGSFTIGANGTNFPMDIHPSDYHQGRTWNFPITIQ